MGIGPSRSSDCSCGAVPTAGQVLVNGRALRGQPDPRKFEIKFTWSVGGYTVADVLYPDAKNYEGRKFIVYKATEAEVRAAKFLDPHFCESKDHLSPFARFEPTEEGWAAALELVKALTPSAWDRILDDEG